ncbi:MAG: sigma-70 family RNA polymerase sigma factor [Nannocystaceae bacterium]
MDTRDDRASALAEESTLIDRARAGDERAMRALYQANEPLVRAFLGRMLGRDPETDDLIQTVFVRAFLALPEFRGDSKFSTWLYQICANTSRNLLRTRYRRGRLHQALLFFTLAREGEVDHGDLGVQGEAERLLLRLRPDLREIFVLYHHEGLTLQEIGEILGLPISTAGDRLTRARKQLSKLVESRRRPVAPGLSEETAAVALR